MTPNAPQIRISDWPQLYMLCWNRDRGAATISEDEALQLYERYWRHVDQEAISVAERQLIDGLVQRVGNGVFCPL